jgi:elongation factor P
MLSISEIKTGKVIQISGEPFVVLKTDHHKMGRGGAVLKVKLRNLISGAILDKTYQGNDKAEAAETEKRKANFMYLDQSQANFMDNQSYEQFSLSLDQLGNKAAFLKEGADVEILYFEDKPVALELPVKVALKVTSAPPGVRGNSAGSVTKQVELETGLKVNVPLFINEGDIIKVNTDTGEYVERA